MTASIDEDTVDFKPNYDSRELEPVVLPAAIPNLLVNGAPASRSAWPPTWRRTTWSRSSRRCATWSSTPTPTLDELMRFIPGPDLPTGGKIIGLDGIRDAYETGRGTLPDARDRPHRERQPRRKGIVVTELPYAVGPEKVIERIKKLVQGKKLQGIADVKDLTDLARRPAPGHRGQERLRPRGDPRAALPADADGGVLRHQRRRPGRRPAAHARAQGAARGLPRATASTSYAAASHVPPRQEGADRLHLVEGLLIAILDIDEVIQLIRSSDNAARRTERLIAVFDLSETQADYILDMPLRRLTRFSPHRAREGAGRRSTARSRSSTRSSATRRCSRRSSPTSSPRSPRPTARRAAPCCWSPRARRAAAAAPLEVADDPCFVLLSSAGLLARTTERRAARRRRRPRQPRRRRLRRGDHRARRDRRGHHPRPAAQAAASSTCRALPAVGQRTPTSRAARRSPSSSRLEPGERALALTSLGDRRARPRARHPRRRRQAGQPRGAHQGRVGGHRPQGRRRGGRRRRAAPPATRRSASSPPTPSCCTSAPTACGRRAAPAAAWPASGSPPASGSSGSARCDPADARRGHGVRLVDRAARHRAGRVKVTPFAEYPAKGRATGGVRCHRFLKGEDALVLAWAGAAPARGRPRPAARRRPARGRPAARRLGHAGRAADRRRRRARRRSRPPRRCRVRG